MTDEQRRRGKGGQVRTDHPFPANAPGPRERAFIGEQDTFFQASVSETGWPYVQHRGGPRGFLKVLSSNSLAYGDFAGNRQFISAGNLASDGRICIILVDFASQRRLKIWGRARIESIDDALRPLLADERYPAAQERAIVIEVEAFDWNCPQHIAPRYTVAELELLAARADVDPSST
jgi:predicted pyridoxine 5'-phosphate oxidase superfamily flavin-nucleotide-binding protein